jgi:hypothetical protein
MRRREFITLLGGAGTWPIAASAQQAGKLYRIGFLTAGSGTLIPQSALTEALRSLGWVEGKISSLNADTQKTGPTDFGHSRQNWCASTSM